MPVWDYLVNGTVKRLGIERCRLIHSPCKTAVRDPGLDERLDCGPPKFYGGGQGVQFLDVGAGAPGVERVEAVGDVAVAGAGTSEREELSEFPFAIQADKSCPDGSE